MEIIGGDINIINPGPSGQQLPYPNPSPRRIRSKVNLTIFNACVTRQLFGMSCTREVPGLFEMHQISLTS